MRPNIAPASRDITKPTINPLTEKFKKFVFLKKQVSDLTKEQDEIKSYLSEIVDKDGIPDEKGNLHYPLPEEIEGYRSLKRERRVIQSLNQASAEAILREKGLFDRCYVMQPVLKEDEVMACLYDGLLTESDIDSMFSKKEIWAFVPNKG